MLEAFDSKNHYYNLKSWLEARRLDTPEPDDLPGAGFTYSIDGIPAAIAFLRMVEGRQGRIDYLTSNPHMSSEERGIAITVVTKALIQLAKDLKLKVVYAHTTIDTVVQRSKALGFKTFPHVLIATDLVQ